MILDTSSVEAAGLEHKPVCFGALTCFAADSDRCKACCVSQACSVKVEANIAEFNAHYDAKDLIERHRLVMAKTARATMPKRDSGKLKVRAPVAHAQPTAQATIKETSAGVQIDIATEARNILSMIATVGDVSEIRAQLQARKNPFPAAMRELWVLGQLLTQNALTCATLETAVIRLGGTANRARALQLALVTKGLAKVEDNKKLVVA